MLPSGWVEREPGSGGERQDHGVVEQEIEAERQGEGDEIGAVTTPLMMPLDQIAECESTRTRIMIAMNGETPR